jgi:hypothetical protein
MTPRRISSPSVGNVTGRSIQNDVGTFEMLVCAPQLVLTGQVPVLLEQSWIILVPGALTRFDVRDRCAVQGIRRPNL